MRGDGGVVGVAVTEGNASRRPGDPSTDDHVADLDEGGDETFGRVAQRQKGGKGRRGYYTNQYF